MMRTNMKKTMETLNGMFLSYDGTVDQGYFLDSVQLIIDNTEYLREKLVSSRRSPIHSVIWCGIMELVNLELKPEGFESTSAHLKKWFKSHDINYVDFLKPLETELSEEREEMLAERKGA